MDGVNFLKKKTFRFNGKRSIKFQVKHLICKYYVEVKDKRNNFNFTGNILLAESKEPKKLGTQYQVFNDTPISRNRKVIKMKTMIQK